MHVPEDVPSTCPVCDADYESVSAHDDGVMVNLLDNERYRRVCFEPVGSASEATVYFFHHTHEQAATHTDGVALDSTEPDART